MMVYGRDAARDFLVGWLGRRERIVLVTGRASYAACGAEAFLAPFLNDRDVTHLTTVGENARAEDVDEKKRALPAKAEAFVAVGGGTAIDTAKLVRGVDFAKEKALDWGELVEALLENVNPQRLANNPRPISREIFDT